MAQLLVISERYGIVFVQIVRSDELPCGRQTRPEPKGMDETLNECEDLLSPTKTQLTDNPRPLALPLQGKMFPRITILVRKRISIPRWQNELELHSTMIRTDD